MQKLAPDFRKALDLAFDRSISHLEHLDESSVAATADAARLREQINKPLAHEGMPPQQVIEELVRDVENGLLGSAGGRFFGWVIGGALPAAVAADWLTSAWQRDGVADLIERCCRHANAIARGIGELPDAELMWEPVINQGLVRFLDQRAGAKEEDHDRRTDEVIAAILKTGEAFVGGTTWRGRRCMRISVCNWQTSDQDVARVVNAVARVL